VKTPSLDCLQIAACTLESYESLVV